jgi:hypothetical protein
MSSFVIPLDGTTKHFIAYISSSLSVSTKWCRGGQAATQNDSSDKTNQIFL